MSRWLVRALVSCAVLVALLLLLPLGTVVEALGRVSPWVWTASLAIFFAGHYANAAKLRILLGPAAPPMRVMVQAQYAGLAANLALPGLAGGDLVRAGYLAPAAGLRPVAVASVADRVIDTATLLVLIAVALPLAGMPEAVRNVVRPAGWWVAAALVAGACTAVVAARLLPGTRAGGAALDGWRAVSARRTSLAVVIALSVSVQALFVITNVWLARSAGVDAGWAAWFVAWPLSKLVAVLPISLGGLGVREAALVSLLTPYGADGTAVLATGLLWQGVLVVSGLVGLVVTQLLKRHASSAVVFTATPGGVHPTSLPPSSGHGS